MFFLNTNEMECYSVVATAVTFSYNLVARIRIVLGRTDNLTYTNS